MVSRECLNSCREKLLSWRAETEEEIKKLGGQANLVQHKDFERRSTLFFQELESREALYNTGFAKLKKINVRISEIEREIFLGVCPECGKNMEEKTLEENPLRVLCVDCQKAVNNRK